MFELPFSKVKERIVVISAKLSFLVCLSKTIRHGTNVLRQHLLQIPHGSLPVKGLTISKPTRSINLNRKSSSEDMTILLAGAVLVEQAMPDPAHPPLHAP